MLQVQDYLAMAKEADEAATKAHSAVAKNSWLTIAATYRTLAAEQEKLSHGAANQDHAGAVRSA